MIEREGAPIGAPLPIPFREPSDAPTPPRRRPRSSSPLTPACGGEQEGQLTQRPLVDKAREGFQAPRPHEGRRDLDLPLRLQRQEKPSSSSSPAIPATPAPTMRNRMLKLLKDFAGQDRGLPRRSRQQRRRRRGRACASTPNRRASRSPSSRTRRTSWRPLLDVPRDPHLLCD